MIFYRIYQADYFLCSERLGFRSWTPEDLPVARGLWADPRVTGFICRQPLSDREIEERLRSEIEEAAASGLQYWPIFELESGSHVGCCGLRPRPGHKICELGFHLRPQCWGRGFATEAAGVMLNYGLRELGFESIFAGHHPDNHASRKVLLKLGFEETGSEYYAPTGLYHPAYIFKKERLPDD
jgi:[ribosomal protein S5]-alanine N-acetyltransferase